MNLFFYSQNSKPLNLKSLISHNDVKYVSDEALDLLGKMLTIDHVFI